MTPREAVSQDWANLLTEKGKVTLGLDLATTEKKTSNPSSLTVMQAVNPHYITRLLVTWKTSDPEVTTAILHAVVDDILSKKIQPKRLCIDASSEIFFAKQVQKSLRGKVPCTLVKGGEKIRYQAEEMDSKTLLGNLYVNHLEDGLIMLPGGKFIKDDHRLVSKEKGRFVASLGKNGEHGDTFDSGKLALWGQLRSGSGSAKGVRGVQVGGGSKRKTPFKRYRGQLKSKNNTSYRLTS